MTFALTPFCLEEGMLTRQLRIRNLFALIIIGSMSSVSLLNCDYTLGLDGLENQCTHMDVRCSDNTYQECNVSGEWESQKTCKGECGTVPVKCGSGQVCSDGSCIDVIMFCLPLNDGCVQPGHNVIEGQLDQDYDALQFPLERRVAT